MLTVPHQEPRGWLMHRELETVFSDMLTSMETSKVTPKRLSFVFALSSQCCCSFLRSLITFLYYQSIEQWESQSYTFILLEGEYSVLEIWMQPPLSFYRNHFYLWSPSWLTRCPTGECGIGKGVCTLADSEFFILEWSARERAFCFQRDMRGWPCPVTWME